MRSPLRIVLCLAIAFAADPAVAKATRGAAERSARTRASAGQSAAPRPAAQRPARAHSKVVRAQASRAAPAASALAQAETALRKVQRDPSKRRYRHEWERAIRGLERAATGRDRAPALLAAARARYALYRFSQVEADRTAALKLASAARRAGAPEAAAFAAAVRREAGDDRPAAKAPTSAPRRTGPAVASSSTGSPPHAVAPRKDPGPAPSKEAAAASATTTSREAPPPAPPGTSADAAPAAPAGTGAVGETGTDPVLDRLVAQVAGMPAEPPAEAGVTAPPPAAPPAPHSTPPPTAASPAASPPDPTARSTGPSPTTGTTGAAAERSPGADDPALRHILEQLRAPHPRVAAGSGAAAAEQGERGRVRRIVVDAGHGGHDTGAIGPSGVREKDVALAMARRLARRLRDAGFDVVLTRDDDRFLGLDERTAIANRARGDLFVSLHTNAHPRRDLAGIETYVLDVGHDRYARRLAARENGALPVDDTTADEPDVRRILSDLDAKASAEPSRRLASAVQRELATGIRAHFGDVRDLGVKSALFYVLLGARMPAVLVETSFISNRVEERRLASNRFQEQVASGIARAIGGFASHEARVARAEGRGDARARASADASD